MKQKFQRGNVVHIAKNLGSSMSHFESDQDAVIIGSYCDQFHNHGRPKIKLPTGPYSINDISVPFEQPENCAEPNGHNYTVLFLDGGECSWYDERQLTLISEGGEFKIAEIKSAREARKVQQTQMRWIVENWKDIRENVPHDSAEYLMGRVGISQPWGSQGEGLAWASNWQRTFVRLDPIISKFSLSEVEEFLEFSNKYAPLKPIDVRIGG